MQQRQLLHTEALLYGGNGAARLSRTFCGAPSMKGVAWMLAMIGFTRMPRSITKKRGRTLFPCLMGV
jgi:hypothetical protein